jgi:hypothetical protein
MPEHEPLDIDAQDTVRSKPEARAARDERGRPHAPGAAPGVHNLDGAADATQAASDAQVLERLANPSQPIPPNRQRTGDPPAKPEA